MELIIATNNHHKAHELKALFARHALLLPVDLGIADFNPEENGTSFFENARIKAEALYAFVHKPVLADDSGLCVDALDGKPGIESARYGSEKGHLLTADEKNSLLLSQLAGIRNRQCAFVCCLVLYLGKQRFIAVEETLEGQIGYEPKGKGGFGYDPIVFLPSYGKTVAELSEQEKNLISHRGKAAQRMAAILDVLEGNLLD